MNKIFRIWLLKRKQKLLLVLIFVFSFLLLNFKLTEVPPGINGDEAHIAYNAMLVAKTGYDQNQKFLPIFISNSKQKDWKQPITFYATVIGFKLFGVSYVVFKEVSVFFALVGALLLFLLIKEILGDRSAFIGLLLYIITPIIFIQSHLGLENIAPVPFVTFWLLMLVKYQKRKQTLFLFLAGLGLGVSFYSYLGMRLVCPVLFILSIFYIFFLERKINKSVVKAVAVFTLSLLPILLISIIIKNQYPGAILAENRPEEPHSYQEFLLPYLSTYDLSFLFIKGDSTAYHSTEKHGIFLLATLPLFILGCYTAAVKKRFLFIFMTLVFFITPILFGFTGSIYRGSRLLVLVPTYIFIVVLGFDLLIALKSKFRNFIIGIMVVIIFFNFYDFVRDYWFDYPLQVKSYFKSDAHLIFKILSEQSKKLGRTPVIMWDIYDREGTAAEFFKQVYFPGTLLVKRIEEQIPPKSVFMISADKFEELKKRNFVKINVILPNYALVIN